MDRAQVLLLGLPIFIFCSDILNLFISSPPPPKPDHHHHHHHHIPSSRPQFQSVPQQKPIDFPVQQPTTIGGIGGSGTGVGGVININFCSSCSYRGNAVTMKNMLEAAFPGVEIVLANYPPPLPKRLLSKAVPVVQFGIFGIMMAGEHIFPRLGITTPPQWYHSLRANRFGSIASTWLLGNFVQSFLMSSGAFEVYCNGELVFSKLKEQRFPGEIELRDVVGKQLMNQGFGL